MNGKEHNRKRRLALRDQGYNDALKGRAAQRTDSDYQQGWKRGKEKLEQIRRSRTK